MSIEWVGVHCRPSLPFQPVRSVNGRNIYHRSCFTWELTLTAEWLSVSTAFHVTPDYTILNGCGLFYAYVSCYTRFHRTTESSGRYELSERIQRCERNTWLCAWSITGRDTRRRSHDGVITWLHDHASDQDPWQGIGLALMTRSVLCCSSHGETQYSKTISYLTPSPYGRQQPRTESWENVCDVKKHFEILGLIGPEHGDYIMLTLFI